VLSENATTTGNFQEITATLLKTIPENKETRMTYIYDQYLFHYMQKNNITYLCLADQDLGRKRPFEFLDQVERLFRPYSVRAQTAISFGLMEFSSTIKDLMVYI
jgi:vesicle-associated membrane protein 7